jgi:hypothetical protein
MNILYVNYFETLIDYIVQLKNKMLCLILVVRERKGQEKKARDKGKRKRQEMKEREKGKR